MRFFGYDITKAQNTNTAVSAITAPQLFSMLGLGAEGINTSTALGQAKAYAACSIVMSVILKKINAIKNLRLVAVDATGADVGKLDAINTISHPNSYQRIEDFIAYVSLMVNVFGRAYIMKVDSIGVDGASELFVVPNTCVTANEYALQSISFEPYGNVLDYSVTISGLQFTVDRDHMFVIADSTADMALFGNYGISRMAALQEQINTFMSSYDATHQLMVNRGMLAIISLTTGANEFLRDVTLPQTASEKKNVEEALNKYGILRNKMKYAITNLNAAVHPVSSTIKDLGLTDVQKSCKKDIADMYQVPSVLLDVEGSTYANAKEAKTILYNDAIIPEANNIFYTLNRIYGFEGFNVMPYYDHLELFQEAKREQAAGMTNLVSALTNAVTSGLLTQQEARDELNKYLV